MVDRGLETIGALMQGANGSPIGGIPLSSKFVIHREYDLRRGIGLYNTHYLTSTLLDYQ